MDMTIFEKALANRMRFAYRGSITVEDLFDLTPAQLDELYRGLAPRTEGDGLLSPTAKNADADLRRAIVKRVFEIKKAQLDERIHRADRAARNAKIMEIVAEKQEGALRDKSIEELTALLAEGDAQ